MKRITTTIYTLAVVPQSWCLWITCNVCAVAQYIAQLEIDHASLDHASLDNEARPNPSRNLKNMI